MPYSSYYKKQRYDRKRKREIRLRRQLQNTESQEPRSLKRKPKESARKPRILSKKKEQVVEKRKRDEHTYAQRQMAMDNFSSRPDEIPISVMDDTYMDTHLAAEAICSLDKPRVYVQKQKPMKARKPPLSVPSSSSLSNDPYVRFLYPPAHLMDHNYCSASAPKSPLPIERGPPIRRAQNYKVKNESQAVKAEPVFDFEVVVPIGEAEQNDEETNSDDSIRDVATILTEMKRSAVSEEESNSLMKKGFICPHQGCFRRYGKSSHLKAHLRSHTGRFSTLLPSSFKSE